MAAVKVLVSGAGLGGLCLAQALRRAGVEVQVFERDRSPSERSQGYRLHLDSDGIAALAQVLPPERYALFDATAMKTEPYTTIVDTQLVQRRRTPDEEHGGNTGTSSAQHMNVNRATVRQVLLQGLEDRVHFGRALVRYETDASGVTAHFDDGSSERGDLLVGADGIHSPVRRQRLPEARTQDTGVRAIYGRVPIAAAVHFVPAQARADTFTVGVDDEKRFLGLGPVLFPVRPEAASPLLTPQGDYVVCIVGGRRELFDPLNPNAGDASSEQLQKLAVAFLAKWSKEARAIPLNGDPGSFFFVEMFTSVPLAFAPVPNVTLLGDAIHAMTPTLGRGANVAMRDAAMLARHLIRAPSGAEGLARALADYEAEMTVYGFDVVRKSAAMGTRLMGQDPLPT